MTMIYYWIGILLGMILGTSITTTVWYYYAKKYGWVEWKNFKEAKQ